MDVFIGKNPFNDGLSILIASQNVCEACVTNDGG